MAFIFNQEIGFGRRIFTWSDKNVRRYRRSFMVRTDNMLADPLEASTAPGLPLLYASYSNHDGTFFDLGAILRTFEVQEQEDPFTYIVDANYQSPEPRGYNQGTGGQIGQSFELNPLLRPPEWRMSFGNYQKPIDKDLSGTPKPLVSSAGQRFDPSIPTDDIRPMLLLTKNFSSFDPSFYALFRNSVNVDNIPVQLPNMTTTLQAGFWKFQQLDAENVFENGIFYSKVTIGLAANPDGWNPQNNVLDHGTQILVNGRRVAATRDGVPLGDVLLDGSGNLLPDNGTPAYLTYQLFGGSFFATLPSSFFRWP